MSLPARPRRSAGPSREALRTVPGLWVRAVPRFASSTGDALTQRCEDTAEKVLETAPYLSSDPDESALQTLFWQLVAPNPTLLIEPTITELIRTAVDLDRARR